MSNIFSSIARFYIDGIRQMTLGKTLWTIVIIKLIILFVILRPLLFPNVLGKLDSDEARSQEVVKQLSTANQ